MLADSTATAGQTEGLRIVPLPQGGAGEVTSPHSRDPGGFGMSRTPGQALLGPAAGWGARGTEKGASNARSVIRGRQGPGVCCHKGPQAGQSGY